MGNYTTLESKNATYDMVVSDLGLIKKSPGSLGPDDNFFMFSYYPELSNHTQARIIGNKYWPREQQMRFAEANDIDVVDWFTLEDLEADPDITFPTGYVSKRDFTFAGEGVAFSEDINEAVKHVLGGGIITRAIVNSKLYKMEFIGEDFLFCWERIEKNILTGYHSRLEDRSVWVPDPVFLAKIKGFITEINKDTDVFFCTLDFLEEDGVLKLIEINTIGSAIRTGLFLDEDYQANFVEALKGRINLVLAEPDEGVSE